MLIFSVIGKEMYEFGDLTKQIGTTILSKKYTFDDLVFLLKALLSFGVGLSPVASLLPVKLLVDLMNYSILGDVGNRLVAALALEIDKKAKEALTGDSDYQLGDFTKRSILQFIGKDEYEFGDISRMVVANMEQGDSKSPKLLFQRGSSSGEGDEPLALAGGNAPPVMEIELDSDVLSELALWDAALESDMKAAAEAAASQSPRVKTPKE